MDGISDWFLAGANEYPDDTFDADLIAYRVCASWAIDKYGIESPEFESIRTFGAVPSLTYKLLHPWQREEAKCPKCDIELRTLDNYSVGVVDYRVKLDIDGQPEFKMVDAETSEVGFVSCPHCGFDFGLVNGASMDDIKDILSGTFKYKGRDNDYE